MSTKHKDKVTHLTLAASERRLAKMRAGQLEVSLSKYVGALVAADAQRSGLACLTASAAGQDGEEVGHG